MKFIEVEVLAVNDQELNLSRKIYLNADRIIEFRESDNRIVINEGPSLAMYEISDDSVTLLLSLFDYVNVK